MKFVMLRKAGTMMLVAGVMSSVAFGARTKRSRAEAARAATAAKAEAARAAVEKSALTEAAMAALLERHRVIDLVRELEGAEPLLQVEKEAAVAALEANIEKAGRIVAEFQTITSKAVLTGILNDFTVQLKTIKTKEDIAGFAAAAQPKGPEVERAAAECKSDGACLRTAKFFVQKLGASKDFAIMVARKHKLEALWFVGSVVQTWHAWSRGYVTFSDKVVAGFAGGLWVSFARHVWNLRSDHNEDLRESAAAAEAAAKLRNVSETLARVLSNVTSGDEDSEAAALATAQFSEASLFISADLSEESVLTAAVHLLKVARDRAGELFAQEVGVIEAAVESVVESLQVASTPEQ